MDRDNTHTRETGFSGIGPCNRRGSHVQNQQDRLADWRPREELMLQPESKRGREAEFSSLQGTSVFLLRLSTDSMGPTCIIEGNLPHARSTDCMLNKSRNSFPDMSTLVFDETSGDPSPARLTHKTNQPSG